ncbi:MAG: hypothetical protein Q7S87_02435 [Agitococcus sp.]|nr:hypothetical protein [Agitococcus sp.]
MSLTAKEIAKTIKANKKNNPIVVFTGAGCSKSAGMPLARELVAEINKKHRANLKDLSDKQKEDYGHCMAKLVPNEQKELLEKHLNKAKINWAHIALASLLKNGYVSKVLTFNFDNILTKACSLDNFYPPIYDLKVLHQDYFSSIPNRSIVHLHGQWSGFELANSNQDTERQAEKLKNYIKETLNNAPSLFIGYSGGADAFFKLVQEDFIGQHRLFWVDYAKEPNSNVKTFIDVNANHRHFIGKQDADQFLIELATELDCFPTEMFKDPINHLKSICEHINDFPLSNKDTQIDLLEEVKNTLKITSQNKTIIEAIKLAESLNQKKYDYIIKWYKNHNINAPLHISKIVASAYLEKSIELLKNNNNQYENFFNKAIEILPDFYQAHAKLAKTLTPLHLKYKNTEYLNKAINHFKKALEINNEINNAIFFESYGTALSNLAQLQRDETLFNQAIEQYKKALIIKPDEAVTINNYGNALSGLAQLKEDEILFNQAIEQYKKALIIKPDDADIINNYGNALANLARLQKDETMFNQAIEQHKAALIIQPNDANIISNYGNALLGLAQLKEDETMFNQAIEQHKAALIIKPNQTYNMACYYALTNQTELSKQYLLHAEQYNTLPFNTHKYLSKDTDLDNVRHEAWFIELLERLNNKKKN